MDLRQNVEMRGFIKGSIEKRLFFFVDNLIGPGYVHQEFKFQLVFIKGSQDNLR